MIDAKLVARQLKDIGFNVHGWGRTEISELPNILLEDEEIYEAVNGIYEGGFALMVATDIRLLLIDKKPLNYLAVEDMRYELISEIDYNHRLIGAYINLSSGTKNLRFSSLNQHRLRKLIGHVQRCMAETKKKESTHPHLEQINQQLQSYLVAQYKQQQKLQEQLERAWKNNAALPADLPEQARPVRPSDELADYLLAQRLLEEHQTRLAAAPAAALATPAADLSEPATIPTAELNELYAAGRHEIFNKGVQVHLPFGGEIEINPLRVAYSKLPLALRNRRFGRPHFHTPSRQESAAPLPTEV